MITNKDDFTKKRKTRVEVLEERIINAELIIEELNKDLKEEGVKEISKIESVLNELREMKKKIIQIETEDNMIIEQQLLQINEESLLIINKDKIRVVDENEQLKKNKIEQDEFIRKLQEEMLSMKLSLNITRNKENELNEQNSILEEKLKKLKSEAYGFDIAKKFEMHQNKKNNEKKYLGHIDPNRNKAIEDNHLAYNLWERENITNPKYPSKLEDLTKQKGLWIGNSASSIDKLMYDIDYSEKKPENNLMGNNNRYQNSLNTNMRKISPMILSNK